MGKNLYWCFENRWYMCLKYLYVFCLYKCHSILQNDMTDQYRLCWNKKQILYLIDSGWERLVYILVSDYGVCEANIAMSLWEGMHLSKGNRWEGERWMGEWGGGGSVYSQLGTRVDGNSRHDTKERFPSK